MYTKTKEIIRTVTKRSIPMIVFILLLAAASSAMGLINPILYSKIIDEVIPKKDTGRLVFYLILLFLVPCLTTLVAGIKKHFCTKLGDRYTSRLRKECFRSTVYAKSEELEKMAPAQIVTRITKECGRIGEVYVTNDLLTFVTEIVTFVSVLITMFVINARLSLLCLVAFPLSALITSFVAKRAKTIDRELIHSMEDAQKYLTESIGAIKTVKLKNGCEKELSAWDRWLANYKRVRQRSSVIHYVNRFLMGDLIVNAIYSLIFFYSGLLVIRGGMTVGELVTFIAFVPKVYTSIRNVLNIRVATSVVSNSFEKIEEILTMKSEKFYGDTVGTIESVEMKEVKFQYDRADFAVSDLNLKIERGEKIGIVGDSGGGKSTLFDLLTALYLAQSGEILINGRSISELDVASLRARIAVVTQDTDLLNGTIGWNLFYPREKDGEADAALRRACLSEFVSALPQGLETAVGARGSLLSGGERQRLCLANALLRDCDLYLLDEFTSALDTKTEEKILDEVFRLSKTVVMISHRVYNVMRCDRVIVMEKGKIVEEGVPSLLIRDPSSKFYDIYRRTGLEPSLFTKGAVSDTMG